MNTCDIGKYLESSALYNYRGMFREYVNGMSYAAYDAGDRDRDGIAGIRQFEERRESLRDVFIKAIGGLPPMDTPLNAVITGVVTGDGCRVEKVMFESRPRAYVTANLYMPNGITKPTGAVLFLCGHFEKAKHDEEYHTVCMHLAQAGLVVLAQDPIGQGERLSYYDSQLQETTVQWGVAEHCYAGHQCLMLGDSIARYFVHDAMRGIDYLCTRPEVDPQRIGVTGNSGGGTQTSLVMICDRRVAAAAPTTFIMSRRAFQETESAQDLEQVWPGMSKHGFDHEDILLSMAPNPVLVNAVTYDFFPIEGTRSMVERVRRFWAMYGREGNLELSEDLSDHHYTPTLAKASARFFARHLIGGETVNGEGSVVPLQTRQLWCTKSGQVRGDFPQARAVHEENIDRLSALQKRRGVLADKELKAMALSWLKEQVLSHREHCVLNPRFIEGCVFNGLHLQSCFWWTQKGLLNHGLMIRDVSFQGSDLPVTIAIWDGGTSSASSHMKWIYRQCRSGRAVMVLDVTADGVFTPQDNGSNGSLRAGDLYGPLYKFGSDLLWLGDSIAALRTYDVLRTLDMVGQWPGTVSQGMKLYCEGMGSLYGRCTALLDRRATDLETDAGGEGLAEQASARHYDDSNAICGCIPGMLQYFDLTDLDKWREG
jgi:hypothetical protein